MWAFAKSSICVGVCSTYPAIAGFPTQHTLKVTDYQINQIYERYEPYGQETLAKCSDANAILKLFGQLPTKYDTKALIDYDKVSRKAYSFAVSFRASKRPDAPP